MGLKYDVANLIKKTPLFYQIIKNAYTSYKSFGRIMYMLEDFTHSQNAEDIIISRLVNKNTCGYYIDIGAHHPIRFSNTYRLFRQGWHGINIDPLPGCMEQFKTLRPNDINLNIACGEVHGNLEYYSFEEPAYNTLDSVQAEYYLANDYSQLKEKINVPVLPLKDILDKYLPKKTNINFMNVDVESYEIHVLRGNDWNLYRPEVMIIECFVDGRDDIKKIYSDEAVNFMITNDYHVAAKVFNATFLVDNRAKF